MKNLQIDEHLSALVLQVGFALVALVLALAGIVSVLMGAWWHIYTIIVGAMIFIIVVREIFVGDIDNSEQYTDAPTAKAYSLTPYDYNGETWLRVQALGEDFIIAPHDLDEGKSTFDYDTAMARLKELNLSTFNKRQLFIVGTLIEEINAKLEEIGGEKFAKAWYVSSELYNPVGCADYLAAFAWCFGGTRGVLGNHYRYYTYFRSRPSLALPLT